MDSLFSSIAEEVRGGRGRVIATHNAVVDLVFNLPLTREAYAIGVVAGEQRFEGQYTARLGGCGINFALAAAAVGHPNVHFAGFLDQQVIEQIMAISRSGDARIRLEHIMQPVHQNVIVELLDGNIVIKKADSIEARTGALAEKIESLSPGALDWTASCSFKADITPAVFEHGENLFLDSGYGYARREKNLISHLLAFLKHRHGELREFMVAANETEIIHLCNELSVPVHGNLPLLARELAERISGVIGHRARVLLHTRDFSTCIGPGEDLFVVPSFDIVPLRRTNAGDTYGGAFLAAYSATFNAPRSCFFATAAVAKRLADDELPTPARTREFLHAARLKSLQGLPVISPQDVPRQPLRRSRAAAM